MESYLNKTKYITGILNNPTNDIYHNYRLKISYQDEYKTIFYLSENGVKLEPEIVVENKPDKVVNDIQLAKVIEDGVPYESAKINDYYLITTIENSDKIIYTPLNELTTKATITAGFGIKVDSEIIDNKEYQKISIDVDSLDIKQLLGYIPENVENKVDINNENLNENNYPTANSVKDLIDDTVGDIKLLLSKV